jgi:hypothetical protein
MTALFNFGHLRAQVGSFHKNKQVSKLWGDSFSVGTLCRQRKKRRLSVLPNSNT